MDDLISYRNESVFDAAENGDLPLTLLLYGINKGKRKILIDCNGNTLLHSAACSNNIEIIQFINEQTNGNLYHQNSSDNENIKLINTKNNKGQTPLLLSCVNGNLEIVKELLFLNSNCFEVDNCNNNIFIILAQNNKLFALHYIYYYITSKYGELKAINLMKNIDCNGNTILDWASNCGHINIVEYIIRANCIPINHVDINNRGPLHWAVVSNKLEMVKFLVKSSFNPLLNDIKSESPLKIASLSNNIDMINAINSYKQINSIDSIKNIEQKGGLICYTPDSNGIMKSNALYSQISNYKIVYVFFHSLYMLILLLSGTIIPVYIYLPLIGLIFISINFTRKLSLDNNNSSLDVIDIIHAFLRTKEIYAGIWISITVCITLYIIAGCDSKEIITQVLIYDDDTTFIFSSSSNATISLPDYIPGWTKYIKTTGFNPLHLPVNGVLKDPFIYKFVILSLIISITLTFLLVSGKIDPGYIDTRLNDYDEILNESIICNSIPSSRLYCHTTFVKKPIRSKYCSQSCLVIARFDHFCVWLNQSIGYNNHRLYIMFLISLTTTTISFLVLSLRGLTNELRDKSNPIELLLNNKFFFITILNICIIIISFGLILLLFDQLYNIAINITTNERINRNKYYYLKNNNNPFDKGILINYCEFFRLNSKYKIDYMKLYEIPDELEKKENNISLENLLNTVTSSTSTFQSNFASVTSAEENSIPLNL